jgi:hypothetical protein
VNIFDGLDEMRLAKYEIRRFRFINSDGDQLHTECLLLELCFPWLLSKRSWPWPGNSRDASGKWKQRVVPLA